MTYRHTITSLDHLSDREFRAALMDDPTWHEGVVPTIRRTFDDAPFSDDMSALDDARADEKADSASWRVGATEEA